MLSPPEVQHCFRIMEHTAWQNLSNPSGWMVGMINRERRRLHAVEMLQNQVNEHQHMRMEAQQAGLVVSPDTCRDGANRPAHEGFVGLGHEMVMYAERFMARPPHMQLMDILSEGLEDDHPLPAPGP